MCDSVLNGNQRKQAAGSGGAALMVQATVGHGFKKECLKLSAASEGKGQVCGQMKEWVDRKTDGR